MTEKYSVGFLGFCKQATNQQLENILKQEYDASRNNENRKIDYAAAKLEAQQRGWTIHNGQRI